MNNEYQAVPNSAVSSHGAAATRWSAAKERLVSALNASNRASADLQQSQKDEQDAWTALEAEAGRAPMPASTVAGGSLSFGRA